MSPLKSSFCYLLSLLQSLHAFNIDTSTPSILITPSSTTDFGYSIAINNQSKQIYVGSPNSYDGLIFKCPTNHHPYAIRCEEIDANYNKNLADYSPANIGASLSVANNIIAVGAPGSTHNMAYHTKEKATGIRNNRRSRRLAGMVYTFTEEQNGQVLQRENIEACPETDLHKGCKQASDGCSRSNCASGVAVSIIEADSSIIVSSPGAFFSQGTVDRFKRSESGYVRERDRKSVV